MTWKTDGIGATGSSSVPLALLVVISLRAHRGERRGNRSTVRDVNVQARGSAPYLHKY